MSDNAVVLIARQATATKAPILGTTFPTTVPFTLTAYSSALSNNFFTDIPFSYSSADGGWKATAGKYWPHSGTLDFLAYSCQGLTPTSVTHASPDASSGITSFVTGDNRTAQADIMFGAAAGCAYSPSSTPLLTFKHAQALVTFTAACPDMSYDSSTNTGVTIESITLANAKYGGTCAVTRSGSTISSITWSSLTNAYDGAAVPGISSQGITVNQTAVGNGIMLPPQSAVDFTVNYTVHSGPGNNTSKSYTYTTGGTWDLAHKYRYAIEITVGYEVVVSASVTDWNHVEVNWFYGEGYRVTHLGQDFTLASGQPVWWRESSADPYERLSYLEGTYGSSVKYSSTDYYVTITKNGDGTYTITLEENPHLVDLGLRRNGKKILFREMNLGARKAYEYGDYFAWGETTKRYDSISGTSVSGGNPFNTQNAPYYSGGSYTKYNGSDGKTVLDPEDDAATVQLGAGWHIPDKEDFQFLISSSNVTRQWVSNWNGTGVNGTLLTGRGSYAGNSIFMPASGTIFTRSISSLGTHGIYWSRTLYTSSVSNAWEIYSSDGTFSGSSYGIDYYSRFVGMPIRPVYETAE